MGFKVHSLFGLNKWIIRMWKLNWTVTNSNGNVKGIGGVRD